MSKNAPTILRLMLAALFATAVPGISSTYAQEMFDSSVPAPGAVVKESPTTIEIKFSQGIYFKDVHLFSDDHVEWPLEWAKTEEDIFGVEIRVSKALPAGKYEIQWWADVRQHHHPDGGVITFTVAP